MNQNEPKEPMSESQELRKAMQQCDHCEGKPMTPENQSDEEYWAIEIANKCSIIPEDKLQLANELFSAITSLRKSWEREKALDAEYRKLMQEAFDAINKEKAGLEGRVKIIEQDRDSWRRCAERLETEKTEPKLTINIEESAIKELFKNQAEELTRLKSRNEELEAEKSKLEERVKFLERGLSGAEYLWQEKVDRLSSALARAHEHLAPANRWIRILHNESLFKSSSTEDFMLSVNEILEDKDGTLALERWKAMEAVVERAKLWWRLHRPIGWSVKKHHQTPKVNCGSDIEGNLALAVSNIEALDAKGGME